MLQRIRENAALCLIALLPLHAFLVTVLTKFIAGPGHRPIAALALWKEGVLGILLVIAVLEIAITAEVWRRMGILRFVVFWKKAPRLTLDVFDVLILGIVCYGLILSFLLHVPFTQFALGFKYDFVPLLAFIVLRRVPWSERFRVLSGRILIVLGVLLAAYGLVSLLLPMSFFVTIGYSPLHSLYVADAPLAAFQQIGGMALRRMQSTMSGPNQLGLWLLLPLGLLLARGMPKRAVDWLTGGLLSVALVLTFSRAAWVGLLVMVVVAVRFAKVDRKKLFALLPVVAGGVVSVAIVGVFLMPQIILRFQSSSDHLKKPVEAMTMIAAHPFGRGLGAAGPASNAVTETCVKLDAGANPAWAKASPHLCVFVGDEQVQPTDRACDCPMLTENWYLQWGVEMGIVGLVVSLLLAFFVLKRAAAGGLNAVMLAFIGVSVAALFLHAFEDAAVAYSLWVLLAASAVNAPRRSESRT